MNNYITTYQAAKKIDCSHHTIRKWCKILGVLKIGRDFLIDEKTLKELKNTIQKHPGPLSKEEKNGK